MTGDSANFADALNSGRFSTARFWLGPSLDWQSPQSHLMGFLCCNSLGFPYTRKYLKGKTIISPK